MQKITDTIVGVSGVGAIELIQSAGIPDITQGSSLFSAVIQLAIAAITFWKLLKKQRV